MLENDPAVVRGIARGVAEVIEQQGRIDFSTRSRLIRRAERLGLKRFDANLVIAAVEYRTLLQKRVQDREASRPVPFLYKAIAFSAIQLPILLGAVWIYRLMS